MNAEYHALTGPQQAAVDAAIAKAKAEPGQHEVDASDGTGEAYAYRLRSDVAWGFNKAPHFRNVARGTVSR